MMTIKLKYGITIVIGLMFSTVAELSWAKNPSSPPASPDLPSYLAQSAEMGLLTTTQGSQINIRSGPGIEYSALHYGVVGDRVEILDSQRENSSDIYSRSWHRVRFVESGAVGWVRGDFLIQTTDSVSNTCHQSLSQVKNTLNNVPNTLVSGIIIENNSLSPLTTRPNELVLMVSGPGQRTILSSGELMQNISESLIQNCGTISSVKIASNNSGWHHVFGLINGRVQTFECIDAGPGSQQRWGQYFCGL
ncbi:SH3 domain-containing protein [Laspinema olomoucense]|uniref:SH3 domain-containing protein n=1 Tax=Laspinema olomoucense TaxID=3231600 RepID=UPI0021BAB504|nr:SH3 domain-containing protein [Laspinema sp. D3a]MCT7987163.1 SH3 domain-containing protein [Laspinema sp. D3a]